MMTEKTILDVCCGSRMFWFDKADERVIYLDKRNERHILNDRSQKSGVRELEIKPNILADFSALPFPDDRFQVVVFDPPHFEKNGERSWLNLKYGTLKGDWRTMLRDGFSECFRVLKPNGVLIFKWCAVEIPLSQILQLTDVQPLIGHKSGKQSLTHWVTFMKPSACTPIFFDVDMSVGSWKE
jgi:ubiquinone/menaquinone biosynthesis C-methylase UbiE